MTDQEPPFQEATKIHLKGVLSNWLINNPGDVSVSLERMHGFTGGCTFTMQVTISSAYDLVRGMTLTGDFLDYLATIEQKNFKGQIE